MNRNAGVNSYAPTRTKPFRNRQAPVKPCKRSRTEEKKRIRFARLHRRDFFRGEAGWEDHFEHLEVRTVSELAVADPRRLMGRTSLPRGAPRPALRIRTRSSP